ncbi:MAG: dihydropteroate synthase [Bacteroidales bacterium]|nr:dihydropteroate synthase [Bacteroidales bacterium]
MEDKDTFFSRKYMINCNGALLDLSKPKVMGVLNVTPDSFYDGGRYFQEKTIKDQVGRLVAEGADIIDIGGYSSRPGADHIPIDEERKRLLPVLDLVRKHYPGVILSVDTFRSEIADQVVSDYRVDIINDISAGEMDPAMFETIAKLQVPYIMMHMKGTPQDMKYKARYGDMMKEITDYFSLKYDQLRKMGVKDIILDPGFGFGKNVEHNYQLLHNLEQFKIFELPILVGLSRKSMIYKILNTTPNEALNGTTVLNSIALMQGADILRVHDVKQTREVITLIEKYRTSTGNC